MLYKIPQFPQYTFAIDIISSKDAIAVGNIDNVVFINHKYIKSLNILYSSIYKTIITYKNTNNKFTEETFIKDIYINLYATKNVKKIAFDTFTVLPENEHCLKIELVDSSKNIESPTSLEDIVNIINTERDITKIKEIYNTIDEVEINELIQLRGL